MLAGETKSHVNEVNALTLSDGAYIQYNRNQLNLRATGDIRWRHSEGKMYDFETLNATDFRYGLSTRYTLLRIKTTLSADGNMYSRRGYGNSGLNTDDFVLLRQSAFPQGQTYCPHRSLRHLAPAFVNTIRSECPRTHRNVVSLSATLRHGSCGVSLE